MLVARIHDSGDLRLHDEPVPGPSPGELLVRVTAVGICGSDVHWWAEGGIGATRIRAPFGTAPCGSLDLGRVTPGKHALARRSGGSDSRWWSTAQ